MKNNNPTNVAGSPGPDPHAKDGAAPAAPEKSTSDKNADPNASDRGTHIALFSVGFLLALGVLAIIVYGVSAASATVGAFSIIAVATMIAGGTTIVGILLGFLFGIPRKLQQGDMRAGQSDSDSDASQPLYGANTNLEQISDWLTKILLGASLTQIGNIGAFLNDFGANIGPALGGAAGASAFSQGIVVFFLVTGFLGGYLWTRLFLGRVLTEAEQIKKLTRLEEQARRDARALALARQQLGEESETRPKQEALDAAIKSASGQVLAHIFYLAQDQRTRNWEHGKSAMEKTIPVFRALIAADKDGEFHRNHGQLGYALKDRRKPDYAGAVAELTTAIETRGKADENGWHYYEANRAACRIRLDPLFKEDKPSTAEIKNQILDDIRVALTDRYVADWIRRDELFENWATLNAVELNSARPARKPSRAAPA